MNITEILKVTANFTNNKTTEIINNTLISYENTIQQNNTYTYVLYGIIAAVIAVPFIINAIRDKKIKLQERREKTQKELRELVDTINKYTEDYNEGKLKIKTIYIDNLPEDLQEELKNKKHLLNKVFNDEKEQKQPFLALIRRDRTIEIKRRAQPGELRLTDKPNKQNGQLKEEKKTINLHANKLHTLKLGKESIKIWIAYEDEAECYPIEEKHLAKTFFQIIQKVLLTEKGLEGKGFKFPKWLIIVAIIAVLGIAAYFAFFNHPATAAQTATIIQNTTQNASTISKTALNNGTKVITIG